MDGLNTGGVILHGIVLHPVATVVPLLTGIDTPIVVAGQEGLVTLALALEGFQFGGDVDGAIAIVTYIKRYDADGVAGYEELIALLIVEHKGKDAAEVLEEVDALLAIEGKDDLTIGTRLELVLTGKAATDFLMVVNLAIDGKHLLAIG